MIYRRFREAYSSVLEEDNLVGVIEKTTELIFPNGQPRKPRPIVTPAQRHTTREAADRKLAAIFPGKLKYTYNLPLSSTYLFTIYYMQKWPDILLAGLMRVVLLELYFLSFRTRD